MNSSDPEALRRKAVEIRAVMETVGNPVTRRDLLALAERFDRLADQLELWIAQPDRRPKSPAERNTH